MIRILLLLVPLLLVYLGIRWFQKASPEEIRTHFRKAGWIIAIITLLLLAATGKLNILFAMLGVAIAFLLRVLPALQHYAPQLHRFWMSYVYRKQQEQSGDQHSRRPRGGRMTKTEALEVLGLKANASKDDIIQAHRKLIARLHPDRGGSDYLAAQINLAKKTLIGG